MMLLWVLSKSNIRLSGYGGYEMDIKEIKTKLPNVWIIVNGKRTTGRVTGRLNEFASVSEFGKLGQIYHFSWQAVERAVNNNTHLNCN